MSADTSRGILLRYLAFTFTPIVLFALFGSLWSFLFWYLFGAAFVCVFFLFHWTESLVYDWRNAYDLGLAAADKTAAMGFPPYTGPGMIIVKMKRNVPPRLVYTAVLHTNASCMYMGWNAWNQGKVPEGKKLKKRSLKHWQVA